MYIIVPQEKREDRSYWNQPFPMRLYLRVIYALSAFIYAGVLCGMSPIPLITQVALATVVTLYVLFFRTIHPNGFGIGAALSGERQKARQELAEGNMDGVPEFLQKIMHYPTPEELEAQREDAERQQREWKEYLEARKEAKKQKKEER